jgi:lipopolysaccharide transport system ATP-binding protein
MAGDVVIRAEGLGKKYLIGHVADDERYVALRDVLARGARNFWRKTVGIARGRAIVADDTVEEFWALKDISFEVKRGEVFGIIGRNGAGKSTLLKILSRITEPTEGRVTINGRVASLLEVGTGFHPELTGRENIYLNGTILGMTRADIREKFEEIVSFAGVERFLDTPVKRYSSGMYVRLAFAVAAHLESEILIVDEVLAVGDASFQEKCLGRMEEVAAGGRTLLLVSHNMSAITQLSRRAMVLSDGVLQFIGPSAEAVEKYISGQQRRAVVQFDTRTRKQSYPGTGEAKILSLRFDHELPIFKFREPIRYIIHLRAVHPISRLCASMTVYTSEGSPVGNCFSSEIDGMTAGEEREVVVTLSVDLAPGSYFCAVAIGRGNHRTQPIAYDRVADTLYFEVVPEQTPGGGLAQWSRWWGPIVFQDLAIESLTINGGDQRALQKHSVTPSETILVKQRN